MAASKKKNTKTKKTTPTPAAPAVAVTLAPAVQGSEEQYHRFLPLAQAVLQSEVRVFRGDPSLVYHNALEGVKNVTAHAPALRAQLPKEDFDRLASLPELVLALIFAVLHVEGTPEQPQTLRRDLEEARVLRRLLLKGFDALKEAGFFTQKEYDTIAAGKGPLDAANDCIALASKYRGKWSAIEKKTAVTPLQLARAAELGTKLQAHFKSARTRRSGAKDDAAAERMDVRDRLWTLITQVHDRLWSVGTLVYGRSIDDYVPALQASRRVRTVETRAAEAKKAAEKATAKAEKAAETVKQVKAKREKKAPA